MYAPARAAVRPPAPEQTRARVPDAVGAVERGGVRVAWEVYGQGEPTILLMPTWSIVHSRHWKAQIHHLARYYRVVAFDGRGNGRSDRPVDPAAYLTDQFVADAVAVMDATATRRAVVVSVSRGGAWSTLLAADHPERVAGLFCIGPGTAPLALHHERAIVPFDQPLDTDHGWAKFNHHYWLRDYRGFAEWFFANCFTEPHSTKQIEDCVGWALDTTPEVLAATEPGHRMSDLDRIKDAFTQVRCPVLVVHGEDDAIRPLSHGAALAEATGGRLVILEGAGHLPHARDPVRVSLLLREFIETVARGAR